MKTLYFVRHAKSSWDHPELPDSERPLIEKGIQRTAKVIAYLAERRIRPGVIISSHARRAMETARMIAKGTGFNEKEIYIDDRLYFFGQDKIFDIIFGIGEEHDSAMLVGHNPDMTNMVNNFMAEKIDYLPTSGIVCITFDCGTWAEVPGAAKSVAFALFPKMLK
jgi:phosphohistidine phosphatase